MLELPARASKSLVERGWVGEKAGQGFYKREKTATGSEILTLDPATMTYRAKQSARLPALEAAKSIEDVGERIKTLFLGKDKVGQFLRDTLGPTLLYTARVAPDIAYSIDDVDRAMKWGFGWELGPFETFDAIGVREVVDACGGRRDKSPIAARDRRCPALRSKPLPRGRRSSSGAGPADSEVGQGPPAHRPAKCRRKPRRSRRRRARASSSTRR